MAQPERVGPRKPLPPRAPRDRVGAGHRAGRLGLGGPVDYRRERLGELLVASGLIGDEQLEQALESSCCSS